jgi:hypothetical protein
MDSARKYSGHVQNLNTEEQKFMEAVSNEISAGMELKLKILQSE